MEVPKPRIRGNAEDAAPSRGRLEVRAESVPDGSEITAPNEGAPRGPGELAFHRDDPEKRAGPDRSGFRIESGEPVEGLRHLILEIRWIQRIGKRAESFQGGIERSLESGNPPRVVAKEQQRREEEGHRSGGLGPWKLDRERTRQRSSGR
jgi:hypothetical protein